MSKKACGLVDYAWYAEVQEHTAFEKSGCPEFNSECGNTGKSVQSCYGISDFEAAIGKSAEAYKYEEKEGSIYMDFYTQKNCEGSPNWNYNNNIQCMKDEWIIPSDEKLMSAANSSVDLPWGCIMHFDQSCYAGNRTIICRSIPDMSVTDFKFTIGSLFVPNYSVKNIVFFEGEKFTGAGHGIKGKPMVNMMHNDANLNAIMLKAKSVLIVPWGPNEQRDENW